MLQQKKLGPFHFTSLIGGRHIADCLTQYEAVSITLYNCSSSYLPSIFGSASSRILPDSIRGLACLYGIVLILERLYVDVCGGKQEV